MTNLMRAAIAALTFASAVTASATAASADRWVRIHNKTSVTLYNFQASPANQNTWGPDRLVSKQVPPGYATTIDLNNAGKGCVFDFLATFVDGDQLEKHDVDVCGGFDITYYE